MFRPIKIKAKLKATGKVVYAEVCRNKDDIFLFSATCNMTDIDFETMRLCTYIYDDQDNYIYDGDILDIYNLKTNEEGKYVVIYDAINTTYKLKPFKSSDNAPEFCELPLGKAVHELMKSGWRVFVAYESL